MSAVFHGANEALSKALATMLVGSALRITAVVDRIARAILERVGIEPRFPAARSVMSVDEATSNFRLSKSTCLWLPSHKRNQNGFERRRIRYWISDKI